MTPTWTNPTSATLDLLTGQTSSQAWTEAIASNFDYLGGADGQSPVQSPWNTLGYAQATANQAITATASPGTDVTSLTVTATPNGTTPVLVVVNLPAMLSQSGTISVFIALQLDGVVVQTSNPGTNPTTGDCATTLIYRTTPTNVSHTWKVSIWSASANTLNTVAHAGTVVNSIDVVQVRN